MTGRNQIQIVELTLSDESIAYGVAIDYGTEDEIEIDCVDYDRAHDLANALEAAMPFAQYDGWTPIKRRA